MLSAQGPLFGAALAYLRSSPMRTNVYIDGFNLYYGALKGTAFKWLNPKQLMAQLLPAPHVVTKIKYFTARVSGASDADAPRRQAIYLNALRTVPEIEIHFGSFLSKTIWRPLINLPIATREISLVPPLRIPVGNYAVDGARPQTLPVGSYPPRGSQRPGRTPRPLRDAVIAEVHTMEEKGSDVNLAAHLINDAWKNTYDAAVVVSNDTDLVEPIRMVTQERQKQVVLVCPGRWSAAPKLATISNSVRHIRRPMLIASQFPATIPNTTIQKPATW